VSGADGCLTPCRIAPDLAVAQASKQSSGLSGGVIAAVVIGCVAGAVMIALLVVLLKSYKVGVASPVMPAGMPPP